MSDRMLPQKRKLTPEEKARIRAGIASDPDAQWAMNARNVKASRLSMEKLREKFPGAYRRTLLALKKAAAGDS